MKKEIFLPITIFLISQSFSFGNLNLEKAGCLDIKQNKKKFSFEHKLIGKFSICQSKTQDKIIFFKSQKSFLNNKFCFIPTHEKNNKSFYVGEPRCLFLNNKEKVFRINFLKNRPGNYENIPINGTLIIPDNFINFPDPFDKEIKIGTPEAYLKCMKEINKTKSNTSFCESFKKVNNFVYIPFKQI